MSIQVKDLTKIYGEQRAIDAISFELQPGEIVGFLGPNGAGKSTTMKILSGFIEPSSGSASVLGMKVNEQAIAVKRQIGYLPELNPLYTEMYVKEYLDFMARLHGVKNRKEAVAKAIDATGLTLESSKRIAQLSKGYKQRVGLAQALINNPKVLILDEPTSGLDPNQMQEIRQLILRLGQERTILLSSHIMQEVEAMCNRVIIINRGKIVADGPVEEVKRNLKHDGKTLEVKFRDDVAIEELKAIEGVNGVSPIGGNRFAVSAQSHVDLAQVLFRFAVDHNTIIEEQQEKTESLETVFQQLTKDV